MPQFHDRRRQCAACNPRNARHDTQSAFHGRLYNKKTGSAGRRRRARRQQPSRPRRRHYRHQSGSLPCIYENVARCKPEHRPRQRLLRFHTPADIGRHSIPSILLHFYIRSGSPTRAYRTLYSNTSPQCWLRSGSMPSRIRRDATPLSTATSARERTSTEYSVYPTPSSGTHRHPTAGHRLTRPQKNEGAPKPVQFRHTLHNAGLLPFRISLPYRQSCLGGGYTRLPGHCCSLREHLAGCNTLQGHRRLWLLHFLHRYN